MASKSIERLEKRIKSARAAREKTKDKATPPEQRAALKKVKRALRKLAKAKSRQEMYAKKNKKEEPGS